MSILSQKYIHLWLTSKSRTEDCQWANWHGSIISMVPTLPGKGNIYMVKNIVKRVEGDFLINCSDSFYSIVLLVNTTYTLNIHVCICPCINIYIKN